MIKTLVVVIAVVLLALVSVPVAHAGDSRQFVRMAVAAALADADYQEATRICNRFNNHPSLPMHLSRGLAKKTPFLVTNVRDGAKGARDALRRFCR